MYLGGLFMKVQNNSIFIGDDIRSVRHSEGDKAGNAQRKTINGSVLKNKFDPIAAKKEQAKKKAMRIVGDAFSNERKMDDDLTARRERIKSLQKDMGDANRAIREIEDDRAALRDTYGVDENSQEEQNLKLLEKGARAKMPGSGIIMTYDELKKMKEIKANGLSEYQERSLEMLDYEIPYATTVYEAKQEIMVENQIISATELERLKNHPMIAAQKQADAVMDEASKVIVSMLIDEARDHIDEEAEKEKEKAKAEKEKEEELQERIDAVKEKKKENEEYTKDILDGVEETASTAADVNAAQQEVKDLMNKMKLIEDDIKGAVVDKSL